MVAVLLAAACTGATLDTTTTTSTSTTTTTTSTTEATTTTTQPLTTTTRGSVEASTPLEAVTLFSMNLASFRESLIDIVGGWDDVESVDKLAVYTPDTGNTENDLLGMAVDLDVTSVWASADNQEDGAWFITRALSTLWNSTDGGWYHELWSPGLRLTNSGTVYECSGEFMVSLADQFAGKSDWLAACT